MSRRLFSFILKLQTAVSNFLKIIRAKTSHCSNNGFPPLVKGNASRELNNLKMLNIPITWSNLIYPYFLLVEIIVWQPVRLIVTIHSVGTLTYDDSSTQCFLVLSVLVIGTLSFSGVTQFWSGVTDLCVYLQKLWIVSILDFWCEFYAI